MVPTKSEHRAGGIVRRFVHERPWWASAILFVGFVVGPAILTYWGQFSDEPLLPKLWPRFMGVGVPPPVLGHVLALVMIVGIVLIVYIVVTIAAPAIRSRTAVTPQPLAVAAPKLSASGTGKVGKQDNLLAELERIYHDVGKPASSHAGDVLVAVFGLFAQQARGREGRAFFGHYVKGPLEATAKYFMGAVREQATEKAIDEFGKYYKCHRRCMRWIEELGDRFGYGFEREAAYRALVEFDGRFQAQVRGLAELDERILESVSGRLVSLDPGEALNAPSPGGHGS